MLEVNEDVNLLSLASYNSYRRLCKLVPSCSWSERPAEIGEEAWSTLRSAYADPDDIDLFTGGLAENPVQGGVLGETFCCIMKKQVRREEADPSCLDVTHFTAVPK